LIDHLDVQVGLVHWVMFGRKGGEEAGFITDES